MIGDKTFTATLVSENKFPPRRKWLRSPATIGEGRDGVILLEMGVQSERELIQGLGLNWDTCQDNREWDRRWGQRGGTEDPEPRNIYYFQNSNG